MVVKAAHLSIGLRAPGAGMVMADFAFEGAIVHSAELRDLIPAFLDVLRTIAPQVAQEVIATHPDVTGETRATRTYDRWCRWCETLAAVEALAWLSGALERSAPPGYWFGAHPRESSAFGFWPDDES